ncbi:MAG: hypothetical protein WBG92_21175 [Thiohalocapsa sp.]
MSDLEQLDIARYRDEIAHDMVHLVGKYCRILGWEIPEVNDRDARTVVLKAMQEALSQVSSAS